MTVYRRTSWGLPVVLALTTVLPIRELAAADPEIVEGPRPVVVDVELSADSSLQGLAVDGDGRPLAQATVALMAKQQVYRARTDDQGRFRIARAPAGLSRLVADEAAVAVRCWVNGTAPPQAKQQALLASQRIQRGQRPIADFLSGPVLIGLIIAAAIAIPIAVHNSKSSAS